MVTSELHLKEVKAKVLHKKQTSQQNWKNTPNIRSNIQQFEISSIDYVFYGRSSDKQGSLLLLETLD